MRLKQIIVVSSILLFLVFPSSASSHEISRKQCSQYASMRALVMSPVWTSRIVYLKAKKACWSSAKIHLLQHPLKVIPWILRAIRSCESGGGVFNRFDYKAENPVSTASGAYQYLDTTWGNVDGYTHAADAPPRIQDMRAIRDIRKGGTTPWVSSISCWGRWA